MFKHTKVHMIPVYNKEGIPTGKTMELKENSELYKRIVAITGELPRYLIIDTPINEKDGENTLR